MGRVLVADDNPAVREALELLLTGEGHTVLLAEDGPSTLEMVRSQRPDVVLLDIEMPGMGGFEVLAKIREDPLIMTTPVIIVSVRGKGSDRDRADELDATDYILKPWQDGEIEMRVKFALMAAEKTASLMGVIPGAPSQPFDPSIPAQPLAEPPAQPLPPPPASPVVAPPAQPPAAQPAQGYGQPMAPGQVQSDNPPPPQWASASTLSTVGGAASAQPAPGQLDVPSQPDSPDAPLILVVEDEEYARFPLVDCMQRAGFRTVEAMDGAKVEAAILEHHPDVILLDMTLPRLDGLQVLRQIKGNPKTRRASVIMVTGNVERSIIEACMSIGARDFVPKPWHGGDMQHRVRRAIKSAQAIAAQAERAVERVRARQAAR
ncbi:MAG: response regulator [Chloroflexi bacterium]|nr:response regulator [Chloroflexota bacterium]